MIRRPERDKTRYGLVLLLVSLACLLLLLFSVWVSAAPVQLAWDRVPGAMAYQPFTDTGCRGVWSAGRRVAGPGVTVTVLSGIPSCFAIMAIDRQDRLGVAATLRLTVRPVMDADGRVSGYVVEEMK